MKKNCRRIVNFFSEATATLHTLQKSTIPSVEKISAPNSLTKLRKRLPTVDLIFGIFKVLILIFNISRNIICSVYNSVQIGVEPYRYVSYSLLKLLLYTYIVLGSFDM